MDQVDTSCFDRPDCDTLLKFVIKETFVDLSNQTSPFQSYYRHIVPWGTIDWYELQYNEVTLQDSLVGLFEKEAEPQHYFSYASKVDSDIYWKEENDYVFSFVLNQDKKVEKRSAYTLLQLLGDFGGFNDAIYFLLSLPMGAYSSAMYSRHVASFFKSRSNRKGKKSRESDDAVSKICTNRRPQPTLSLDEKSKIFSSMVASAEQNIRIAFFKALCYFTWLCRRDKQLKAKQASNRQFDRALDVVALYQTHMNLQLYLDLFMSKAQKLLFLHHAHRSVKIKDKNGASSSDEDGYPDLQKVKTDPKDLLNRQTQITELLDEIKMDDSLDRKLIASLMPQPSNSHKKDHQRINAQLDLDRPPNLDQDYQTNESNLQDVEIDQTQTNPTVDRTYDDFKLDEVNV